MLDLETITDQVAANCNISDARHAGHFSICGLALRLRDLYKWEKGLPPWEEKDAAAVLEWIGDKEQQWEQIAGNHYADISISGRRYDPFDTCGINALLEPHGRYYGAGYANSLKPTFFLAQIEGSRRISGQRVYTLGRELARDLLTLPALLQDDCVLLRKESAMLFLWDQVIYVKESGRAALSFALACCGIKDQRSSALQRSLALIFRVQKDTFIHHEIGEMQDTVFDRRLWREIVAAYPHSPVELLARAIKDLLADTNEQGTLPYIIAERKTAALSFYVAFFDGLAKQLFPELPISFREFMHSADWGVIEQAVSAGYSHAKASADLMMSLYRRGKQMGDPQWARQEIESRLLRKV